MTADTVHRVSVSSPSHSTPKLPLICTFSKRRPNDADHLVLRAAVLDRRGDLRSERRRQLARVLEQRDRGAELDGGNAIGAAAVHLDDRHLDLELHAIGDAVLAFEQQLGRGLVVTDADQELLLALLLDARDPAERVLLDHVLVVVVVDRHARPHRRGAGAEDESEARCDCRAEECNAAATARSGRRGGGVHGTGRFVLEGPGRFYRPRRLCVQ
ncbi:MAG: hypothetical protein AB7O97_22640 [Planctomycetota bacterium]